MTNAEAISSLCTAIVNNFYPDTKAVEMTASTVGLDPEAEEERKDPLVFRSAVLLVRGFIEGSHSENGLSTSVRSEDAIKQSIRAWCSVYDLDPNEVLGDSARVVEDGTHLW